MSNPNTIQLCDAVCRVRQAEAILFMWLESMTYSDSNADMIGGLITIIDGVADSLSATLDKISAAEHEQYLAGIRQQEASK